MSNPRLASSSFMRGCVCVCVPVCTPPKKDMLSLAGKQQFRKAPRRDQLWLPAKRPPKIIDALDWQGPHRGSRPASLSLCFPPAFGGFHGYLLLSSTPLHRALSSCWAKSIWHLWEPSLSRGKNTRPTIGAALAKALLCVSWISFPEFLFSLGNWDPWTLSYLLWRLYHGAGLSETCYYNKGFLVLSVINTPVGHVMAKHQSVPVPGLASREVVKLNEEAVPRVVVHSSCHYIL